MPEEKHTPLPKKLSVWERYFPAVVVRVNPTRVDTIFAELELALTSLALAEISATPTQASIARTRWRRSIPYVTFCWQSVSPEEPYRGEIEARLCELQKHLEGVRGA